MPSPIDHHAERKRRFYRILTLYWAITIGIGLLLPQGESLQAIRGAVQSFIEPMVGVVRIAAQSFDPAFVEVFFVVCLITALVLAVISMFIVPGAARVASVSSIGDKVLRFVAGITLLWVFLLIPFIEVSIGPDKTRSAALIFWGASSKWGALTILNCWGFGILLTLMVMKATLTARVIKF
jgi:hypothetical protein